MGNSFFVFSNCEVKFEILYLLLNLVSFLFKLWLLSSFLARRYFLQEELNKFLFESDSITFKSVNNNGGAVKTFLIWFWTFWKSSNSFRCLLWNSSKRENKSWVIFSFDNVLVVCTLFIEFSLIKDFSSRMI